MGEEDDEDKPPLHLFFDIGAMQDTGRNVPNLLIVETEYDDRPVRFKVEGCVRDFLEWLETLTEEDTRPLTVIAHNFQGMLGKPDMLDPSLGDYLGDLKMNCQREITLRKSPPVVPRITGT